MLKVIAVVVTYNRLNLLKECINALKNQTFKLQRILIIDNNSNDGTENFCNELKKNFPNLILYDRLNKNLGGSGGFNYGIKKAATLSSDFVWIMDDDTIPKENALEQLINANNFLENKKVNWSFLASQVRGKSGRLMNVPFVNEKPQKNGYSNWNEFLDTGLVGISCATFVSILVKFSAIKKVGLPFDFYFIWGDDTEYTTRLVKFYGNAYLVGQSLVIHKRKNEASISLKNEFNKKRIKNYYLFYRNQLLNTYLYKKKRHVFKLLIINILESYKFFLKFQIQKWFVIQKGIFSFLFGFRMRHNAAIALKNIEKM